MKKLAYFPSILIAATSILSVFLFADVKQIGGPFSGIDTDSNEILVKDGMAVDSTNVNTDTDGALRPRLGYVLFSTEPCNQLWNFRHSNGNDYMIVRNGANLKATTGSGVFSIAIATVTTLFDTDGVALGDKFFFSNETDGLKYWDTSSVVIVSSTLKFDMLANFKGRLWGAGLNDDPNTVYVSKYLDGTDFVLRVNPTDEDPARINIQGAINEPVKALYSSFQDSLIWAKNRSFGAITGSRRSNFNQRTYSDVIGTSYKNSIQDCSGNLRFFSGTREVWNFDGANLIPITDGVNNLFDDIQQGSFEERFTQSDTNQDFDSGAYSSGTYSASNSVSFQTLESPDDDFLNTNSVDTSNFGVGNKWINMGNTYTQVRDGFLTFVTTAPGGDNSDYARYRTVSNIGGAYSGSNYWIIGHSSSNFESGVRYKYGLFGDPASINATQPTNLCRSLEVWADYSVTMVTFSVRNFSEFGGGDCANAPGGAILLSSAIRPSELTGYFGIFRDELSTGTLYINFNKSFADPFNATLRSLGSFSTLDLPLSTGAFKVLVDRITLTGSKQPLVNYKLDFFKTYGDRILKSTYTSAPIFIGSDLNSYKAFSVHDTVSAASATITYGVYRDSDTTINVSDRTTYLSSTTITNGAIPNLSSSTYAFVAAFFNRNVSTDTAYLDDFTLTWNSGNTTQIPSIWHNSRYRFSVISSSETTINNLLLEYDRDRQWQKSSIAANAFLVYGGSPYFGNSSGVFEIDSGNSDNGSEIPVTFKTKSHSLGNINARKDFNHLFITTEKSPATLSTNYYVDGDTIAIPMSSYRMNEKPGIQDVKIPFSVTGLQNGKTISLEWIVSSTSPWSVLNSNLYYTPESEESE